MINATTLLKDLKAHLPKLEDDIRLRLTETAEEEERLKSQYQEALDGGRTGAAWEMWRDEQVTQAAVAWVLAGVFVRFMEDNGLIDQPWLSGPGERRRMAQDQHTLFFRSNPTQGDREYFIHVFEQVAGFPAVGPLFDKRFNPLWQLAPSGDGAGALLQFWQAIDPASGDLIRDFTDPDWNTRFLGDLYQDLSEAVRKKYALLQTPEFVEEFILDRTLTPAIEAFGLNSVRLIDPTCGSGHFLLGAFDRFFTRWQTEEPGTNVRALAQRALNGVWGVDINPYAVAIARFRLLVSVLKVCSITRMADAPGFEIHLAVGDSLLHGPRFRDQAGGMTQMTLDPDDDPLGHLYETEDKEALKEILGQQYHAVVGNPPYITPKDKALNEAYRDRYATCHRQYSLGVPFTERFFDLAIQDQGNQQAGFVGMITANSFMKREFGKKLIKEFFRLVDLDTVIDTSGAYIPGHSTPTVILFGRHRDPMLTTVRTVQGIRGEPSTPANAAQGIVWSSIEAMIDQPGEENDFISVVDTPRLTFESHPWSLGGGGASELKDAIEDTCETALGNLIADGGRTTHSGGDPIFYFPENVTETLGIREFSIYLVEGEAVRDWNIIPETVSIFPYNQKTAEPFESLPDSLARYFWCYRTPMRSRVDFGSRIEDRGLKWFEHSMFFPKRYLIPLSIAFAFVATHNHFVLDRGGKVFKQTAPVIKLPPEASEADHLALLGLLNSSVACFWARQTVFQKGGFGSGKWEERQEWDGTKLKQFPVPSAKPQKLATQLDKFSQQRQTHLPAQITQMFPLTQNELDAHRTKAEYLLSRMIALQEELDWQCYQLYGIIKENLTFTGEPPEINLGERPFEILMGRKIAKGDLESTWFDRHGSTPITEIPNYWPANYRAIVEKRLKAIKENRNIRLIEQPEYKRRWNLESCEKQEERALRQWLLDCIEAMPLWKADTLEITTCARLADQLHHDGDFLKVAELYQGRADFDLTKLVTELVSGESVPFLPIIRYKDSGLRKRDAWERTWALQRKEDAGEKVGDIPVPPKYTSGDFKKSVWWRLRGKLDVPKERFILYPHCEKTSDPTPVIAWAGWNHLQQAQALAGYFLSMKENEGWSVELLKPLLWGLLELLPWLKQWHNEIDPAFGTSMGDYFEGFFDEQSRSLGITVEEIKAWHPPKKIRVSRQKVQSYAIKQKKQTTNENAS